MFYRFLIIIAIFFSVSFSQSFFNRMIGNEVGYISARSHAMGQTYFMTSNNSALTLRNPARLSQFKPGIYFDYNPMGSVLLERRSIDLKDYFGDFLVEGDYVANNNVNFYNHFGLIINTRLFFLNFSAGLSHGPWSSFDYSYEEEVRGSASFNDGIIGIRDPIEGYHILENSGDMNLTSVGVALGINESVSVGASLNYIHDGSYDYKLDAITIAESPQNLASVFSDNGSVDFDGEIFPSLSVNLKTGKTEIAIGYESNANIQSPGFNSTQVQNFDYSLGLPIYLENNQSTSELELISSLVNIEKPEKYKIGLNYRNGYRQYTLLSIELIQKIYENNIFQDSRKLNLGIEYVSYKNTFRMGLSYKESEFRVLAPVTAFTLGTSSKVLDKLIFDIGASYSYQKYNYIDLFPVNGDVRPDYDNIHESVWSIISTISYRL